MRGGDRRWGLALALAGALAAGECRALDPASAGALRLLDSTLAGAGEFSGDGARWAFLPRSIDLRPELDALRVNFIQQGDRNTCAAFSATSVLELELRRLGHDIDLSEQYALWAAQEAGADPRRGLTFPELARGLLRHGMCREELMPYKSAEAIIPPSPMAAREAAAMPGVMSIELVPFDTRIGFSARDLLVICEALSRMQPVCIGSRWNDSGGQLARGNFLEEGRVNTGHMVLLTGYEFPAGDPGEGFFHFRNSWGLSWGDFGYAKMPFSYARKHGVGAVIFGLDWSRVAGGAGIAARDAAADATVSRGFVVYLATALGAGLALLLVAVWIPGWFLGRRARGVLGALGFASQFLLLYALMVWCVGTLLARAGGGDARGMLALSVALAALLVLWYRLTARHFDMGPGRALAHMLLVALLWNVLSWQLERVLPATPHGEWREATAGFTLERWGRLLVAGAAERAIILEGARARAASPPGEEIEEASFLKRWEADLREAERRMNPLHPVARHYHAQRKVMLEGRKAALQARQTAAAPAPGATAPAQAPAGR